MKRLIILFILSALSLQSQSISIFDIDNTNFPTMRAKFFAFDAAGSQTRPSASELSLSEDRVNRVITNVSCPNLRYTLSACIMVDTYSYIYLARKGAERFVSFLQMPPDEVGITYMSGAPLIHRDFTRDRVKAINATTTIPSAPGVDIQRMFYAEKTGGVPFITPRRNDRKALILISDLHCPNLNLDEKRLYADAKANGIRIFSVLLGTTDYSGLFKRVAKETNGVVFEKVTSEAQIYNVLEEIARRLTIEPCIIEWQSDYVCKSSNYIETELNYQNAEDNENYTISYENKAELTFSPAYITFENPPINTKISQEVTITAKKKDFNISDIILSNPLFEITPKSLTIPANQSRKLMVSYTASDSAYTFCKFEIKSDICDKSFFVGAGWKGIKPKIKSLKLTHPNGGETFVAGSDTVITWEGIPATDTVSLDYSIDSGKNWKNITEKATGLKYLWKNIPLPPSYNCLIRVNQYAPANFGEHLRTLKGHKSYVESVAFSPDGSMLATKSYDKTIRLWDPFTGMHIYTISDINDFSSGVAFSPDGSMLALADYDAVKIWNPLSGQLIKKLLGHSTGAQSVAFSHDGSMLASGGFDAIKIWNPLTGQLIRNLTGHEETVQSVAFSPDGSMLASGGSNNTVKIWDTNTGQVITKLNQYGGYISTVTFSSDGSILASCNIRGTIMLADPLSGKILQTLYAPYGSFGFNSIAFNPESTIIASGQNQSQQILFWNSKSGQIIKFLHFPDNRVSITALSFSPDGSMLASGGEGIDVMLWSVKQQTLQSDQSDTLFSIIAPDMALKLNDIDMGRVFVGSYVDKPEKEVICNEGTAPLHVLGLDVTNGNTSEFAIPRGAGDFFLAPGDCQAITFQFSPTQVGQRNAKITVRSTIGNKVDSINIRGEGVQPNVILNTQVVDMSDVLVNTEKDSIVLAVINTGNTPIKVKPVQYLENNDLFSFDGKDIEFDLAANSLKSLTLYFKPKEQGRVTGRIGFEYNGVGSPLVMLLFGRGIGDPYAEINLINQSAYPGEKISVPLILKNEEDLSLSKITSLSLDLEYNRTLLRPIGNYNPIVNGDNATINLNIPYNKQKAGETLTTIDFDVALGNAQGCELALSNPKSNDNNAVIYAKSGTFTLLGICEDGGARLINPELQAGIMSITPNPTNDNFNIEVSLIEAAPSELILLNSLGQQVMTILSTTDTGKHTKSVNADQLSTGIYYLQLRTATYIENKVIRVEK
jgi:WD40 repeat protein